MSEKCMIDVCSRPRAKRGLCLPCYSVAKKMVEAPLPHGVTWDRLVELGLCEKEKDPFTSAYEKVVE